MSNFTDGLVLRDETIGEAVIIEDPFPAIYDDTLRKLRLMVVPFLLVYLVYVVVVLLRWFNAL